ncbi:MAG: stage V sporulation protein AC [Clostridia bacterium]|nr:stage V sporulation protein AC [Clostridia bacterium]
MKTRESKSRNKNTNEGAIREEYQKLVNARMPKSKTPTQLILAFTIGGAICMIGQLIGDIGEISFGLDEKNKAAFTAISLIFIGAFLTGIGVYDRLGVFAGAGSVVPITGFANSVVAPAMEHRREGLVMGVGAQLFSYAGPVLVYGITASVVIGLITWAFAL